MRFSLQATLLIWFLIGCYLNFNLFITERLFIPNFIAYFFASMLLMFHLNKLFIKRYFLFVISFFLVSVLSIIFSPKLVPGILKEQFLAFFQLILSVFSAMGVLFCLEHLGVRKVARILFVFCFVLFLGSIFERFIPLFSDLSNWFRNTFYSFDIYASDNRDITMVGFIRPKVFSREPSFLSQFLVLFLVFWHTLSSFRYKTIVVLFLGLFSVFLTGSPKVILLFPVLILINFSKLKRLLWKYQIISVPVFSMIIVFTILVIFYFFNQRIDDVLEFKDQSFNMRIFIPGLVLIFTLIRYPFFGVGLGAKENSLKVFNETLSSYGYDWMIQKDFVPNFHSYFLEAVHFYGVLGLMLIIYVFNKYLLMDFSFKQRFVFWTTLILIGLMGGSVVGIRTWFTIVILYFSISNMKKI